MRKNGKAVNPGKLEVGALVPSRMHIDSTVSLKIVFTALLLCILCIRRT